LLNKIIKNGKMKVLVPILGLVAENANLAILHFEQCDSTKYPLLKYILLLILC